MTKPQPNAPLVNPERSNWRAQRLFMEKDRNGWPARSPFRLFYHITTPLLLWFLRHLGLYEQGIQNGLSLTVRSVDIVLPGLPAALEGYRILHITDLHIENQPKLTAAIPELVNNLAVDCAVLTGDIGCFLRPLPAEGRALLQRIRDSVAATDGFFAIPGNHDSTAVLDLLESIGFRLLLNETTTIQRGDARLQLTGLDDVNCFYTPAANAALHATPPGTRIALVHSPEFARNAAAAGFDFYLCGHTHGGQMCLPGGIPVATGMYGHRGLVAGLWRVGRMVGYTSTGAGVSRPPVRFNCPGEVTVLTLRAGTP